MLLSVAFMDGRLYNCIVAFNSESPKARKPPQAPEGPWAAALHATLDRASILRRLMKRHTQPASVGCAVVSLVPHRRLGEAFRTCNRRTFRCAQATLVDALHHSTCLGHK